MIGRQINLDEGQGQIISGYIIDDIRNPCTELQIVFECSEYIEFYPSDINYFTYKGIDWVPISFGAVYNANGLWHYDCVAHPTPISIYIEKEYKTTFDLATILNIKLLQGYQSIPLKYSFMNMYSATVLGKLMEQSFNEAYNNHDMGNALFLYFNSQYLLGTTYKDLMNSQARALQDPEFMQGQNIVTLYDERLHNVYGSATGCKTLNKLDYLKRILGKKIQIQTTTPSVFMNTYTMNFADTNEFNQDKKYLCIRTECDITEAFGYKNLYSEVLYV